MRALLLLAGLSLVACAAPVEEPVAVEEAPIVTVSATSRAPLGLRLMTDDVRVVRLTTAAVDAWRAACGDVVEIAPEGGIEVRVYEREDWTRPGYLGWTMSHGSVGTIDLVKDVNEDRWVRSIAHEIGHALLGSEHKDAGIMMASASASRPMPAPSDCPVAR